MNYEEKSPVETKKKQGDTDLVDQIRLPNFFSDRGDLLVGAYAPFTSSLPLERDHALGEELTAAGDLESLPTLSHGLHQICHELLLRLRIRSAEIVDEH